MTLCTGGCSSLRSLHALRRPVIVHMHARAWCPTGRMCLDDQLLPFCGRVMRVDAGLLYRAELLECRDCRLQRWTNLIRFQNRYNIDTILSKYRDIDTIIYYSQTIFETLPQPHCENSRSHANDVATAARTTPQTSDSGKLLCFTVTYLVIQRAS